MISVQYNKKIFNDVEILEIKNMYLNLNMSATKIGEVYGVSKIPIIRILKKLSILRKGTSDGVKIILTNQQKNKIRKLYLYEYKNCDEIGQELNLTPSFINKYLCDVTYRRNKSEGVSIGLVKRFSGINYDEYIYNLPEYEKYRRKVVALTKKQPICDLLNYNKRGVSGVNGNYHLDHKYSICEGFKNNIKPEIIANINNLVFIPWEENVKKRTKCSITKEDLIKV